jgi:hypothetical protein
LLREWRGLSYAEISDELGLSRSAVEALLFRARRALARNLGGGRGLRGLDLAGLLGALRSLLEGSAAKLAVGALALAAAGPLAAGPLEQRSRPIASSPIAADHQTRVTDAAARSSKAVGSPLAPRRATRHRAAPKAATRRGPVSAPIGPAHHRPADVVGDSRDGAPLGASPSVDNEPNPARPADADLPAVAVTVPSLPTPPAVSLPSLPPVPAAPELPLPPPLPQVQNPLPPPPGIPAAEAVLPHLP